MGDEDNARHDAMHHVLCSVNSAAPGSEAMKDALTVLGIPEDKHADTLALLAAVFLPLVGVLSRQQETWFIPQGHGWFNLPLMYGDTSYPESFVYLKYVPLEEVENYEREHEREWIFLRIDQAIGVMESKTGWAEIITRTLRQRLEFKAWAKQHGMGPHAPSVQA